MAAELNATIMLAKIKLGGILKLNVLPLIHILAGLRGKNYGEPKNNKWKLRKSRGN